MESVGIDICQSLHEEVVISRRKGSASVSMTSSTPDPAIQSVVQMIIRGKSVVVVTKTVSRLATRRIMLVPAWMLVALLAFQKSRIRLIHEGER